MQSFSLFLVYKNISLISPYIRILYLEGFMEVCEEFRNYLITRKQLSKTSVETFVKYVNQYLKFHKDMYDEGLGKLSIDSIDEYIRHIKSRKLAGKIKHQSTINKKFEALESFNVFLIDMGIQEGLVVDRNKFISIKPKDVEMVSIDYGDIERFREVVLKNCGTREYAIITMLAYTGIKLKECLALKFPNDIDLDMEEIVIRYGKRGQVKRIPMNYKIKIAIIKYLMHRESCSNYLFQAEENECLEQKVNSLFRKYAHEINPNLTLNQLRSFYNVKFLNI
jgi:integrase/recombinase XerD